MALIKQNEPVYEILELIPLLNNDGSGQTVQICRLGKLVLLAYIKYGCSGRLRSKLTAPMDSIA